MKAVDDFLNNTTMYRLMVYFLLALLGWAVILSLFGFLPFNAFNLVLSTVFIVAVAWITNKFFAVTLKAPTNLESVYISALILSLIITPVQNIHGLIFLFWVGVWASASKFIFAIGKNHIFNPAVFAVLLTSLAGIGSASWWVGTAFMAPVVLIGGFLIVRKISRWDLVLIFLAVSSSVIFTLAFFNFSDLASLIKIVFLDSPILFFAFVMLTEPQTTPPAKVWRFLYGGLVGLLFAVQIPELALVLGNVFSYLVSPKDKLFLKLQQKIKLAPHIYDFIFEQIEKRVPFIFEPGQYMEWTLGYKNPDSRGNRNYFTIASSPTEDNLRVGVRFSEPSSAYKRELLNMAAGDQIVASSLAGEFVLPKEPRKFCFVAGGIGITPYRSIIKNMIDKNERKDIILLYSVEVAEDAVYMDVFKKARNLGLKTLIHITNETGFMTKETVEREVPDYKDRMFYLSGPHGMVKAFEKILSGMGINKSKIKVDYFPGYV